MTTTQALTIRPQPMQERFLSSPADIVIYGGGAGAGKTWSLVVEPLRHIRRIPGFGAVIFRRTSPQITNEGGLWDEASSLYPQFGGVAKQGSLEFAFPPHNNTVSFRHLQHEQNKYDWQGTQVCLLCFDELPHFSESQFWYMLSRNRSTCGIRPYVRATCNPDPGWVKRLLAPWVDKEFTGRKARSAEIRCFIRDGGEIRWVEPGTPDSKSITFIEARVYDNAILMEKDPGYLANLKALPPIEQARLLHGDWDVRREGLVYPDFEQCLVDSAPPGEGARKAGGIDFGFRHPFAALSGFLDDDVLWITACRCCSNVTTPVHSEALPRGLRWFADPSRPETIAEFRNAGHDVVPCVHIPARGASGEKKNPTEHGIDLVSERMRTGRLKIVRQACLPLVRELCVYHYDEKNGQPVKEDDHACFPAGTRVKTHLGDVPIEEVKPGDKVLTREGWFPVKAAGINGFNRPIHCVRFSDGRSLFGTGDHPVWTENNGWVRLDALRYGDIMDSVDYSFVSIEERACQDRPRRLFSRDGSIAAIRNQATEHLVFTSNARGMTHFIGKSGNQSTGLFPTVGMSITETGIHSTTTSQISNAFPGSTTSPGMQKSGTTPTASNSGRISIGRGSRRPSGIDPKKDESGIGCTERQHGPIVSRFLDRVKSAARRLSRSPGETTTDSAQTTASRNSDAKRDWISKLGPAFDAENRSRSIGIPCRRIAREPAASGPRETQAERLGRAKDAGRLTRSPKARSGNSAPIHVLSVTDLHQTANVYNLTVDGPHEYYANGVLVKNCDAMRYMIVGIDRGRVARPIMTPDEHVAANVEAMALEAELDRAAKEALLRESLGRDAAAQDDPEDPRWRW